jgi:hypothetical protein
VVSALELLSILCLPLRPRPTVCLENAYLIKGSASRNELPPAFLNPKLQVLPWASGPSAVGVLACQALAAMAVVVFMRLR